MRMLPAVLAVAALPLLLAGCVSNAGSGPTIEVSITDDGCAVATAAAHPGPVAFHLTNRGTDENEFYVLATDKKRVVAEKEHIAAGQTATLTTQLDAGAYFTACKFRNAGDLVGVAEFTVAG